MSEHGAVWRIESPAPPWPDNRFDGVVETTSRHLGWEQAGALTGPLNVVPPLDPDQATPERVMALASAALAAADDIETVLRLWPYPNYPLEGLRRLAQEVS